MAPPFLPAQHIQSMFVKIESLVPWLSSPWPSDSVLHLPQTYAPSDSETEPQRVQGIQVCPSLESRTRGQAQEAQHIRGDCRSMP